MQSVHHQITSAKLNTQRCMRAHVQPVYPVICQTHSHRDMYRCGAAPSTYRRGDLPLSCNQQCSPSDPSHLLVFAASHGMYTEQRRR